MQRYVIPAAIVVALGLGAGSVEAQQLPLSIELRGGAALPSGDWNEDDSYGTGLGFGAAVRLRPTPLLGVYAGWESFSFGVDDADPEDLSLTDSGFRAGAELSVPVSSAPVSPFVSAGLFYGKAEVELEGEDGTFGFETDSSIGFEAAVGLGFSAGPVILRPAVGYRTHEVEFGLSEAFPEGDETISYITFILGVALIP